MKNILIGRYIPGNSPVHNLDTRTKLFLSLLVTIVIFCTWNPISLSLILLSCIFIAMISGISISKFISSNLVIISISLFTTLLNLFFKAESNFITSGSFHVTASNIINSITLFLRLISLVLMSSLLMFTTSANDISRSIENMFKPLNYIGLSSRDIALTITITLRFLPIISEEAQKILDAQRSRGANFKNRNIFKNLKALLSVIIPLLVSSINRANDLATALESRCYESHGNHTDFKVSKFKRIDIFAVVYVFIMILGVMLCNLLIKI